ncbi:Aldo/keto reductase [Cylindrobasidium torrendii FP15055 ss-10]|uniref:Aldo/keto reductase n=1 Tax=Cylindrobasidium torrendii FP15055 ss-10 TaxID=1314674 RepID=A0A0D7BK28_9AGAR|nr:Aldo/keto reductase [Cylindrobasidium torrendii FP15055 ss-10]
MAPTRIPLIFGTMTMGFPGGDYVRTSTPQDCQNILDVFFDAGHTELDTARVYSGGTTEQMLAKLDLKNATIDTKVMPIPAGGHRPENLRKTFKESLAALKRDKVRVLYLHAPDRSVPFEDTCREMNSLHEEGLFETFGLSNFAAWEVAEVVGICKANNWVQPKIYQVMYNAITRDMETELLPCCRKFGLRIVSYNPLAGGLFAGKVLTVDAATEDGGRYDSKSRTGQMYRARYLNEGYMKAIQLVKDVADKHGLRLTEVALRWCQHHSKLTPEDGVILGASSVKQLKDNVDDSAKGPLPEDIVAALDEAERIVRSYGGTPKYWR